MDWNLFTGERAGTDALLLADFAKDAHGTYGADLGCGSGILLLLLLLGDESRRMTGVDIRESAAASARENLRAFALEERGEAVCADYRSAPFESESLDFIVSNPPYFPAGRGAVSPNAERAAQRTESATVSELCSASARYLKPGGQFFSSTGESARVTFSRRCTTPISRRCAGGTFSPRRESARPFFSWKP